MTGLRLLLTAALILLVPAARGVTYTIAPDGSGDFATIQTAIMECFDGDVIELADGVFAGTGNRDLDYQGRAITIRSQSGDPEACILDCEGTETAKHRGVCFHSLESADAILENVTIMNGYGWTAGSYVGGGAICLYNNSSPTIRNCIFTDNTDANDGGAIYCEDDSAPLITRCDFRRNSAYYGGAICFRFCALPPTVTGCTFTGNEASARGGAIYCWDSDPSIENCSFADNVSVRGGALACYGAASPEVSLCTFAGDGATLGGGIYCVQQSAPLITNCTLYGTSASEEGGGLYGRECNAVLENTIIAFATNGEAVSCVYPGSVTLACCNLYGNAGGDWTGCIAALDGVDGNLADDPLFCDAIGSNFRLQPGSPCAPENHPTCDLIGAWPAGCSSSDVPADDTPRWRIALTASPNPFSHGTRITYALEGTGTAPVTLAIFDASGRRVRTLLARESAAGQGSVTWDGRAQDGAALESGVYFCRLRVRGESTARQVILLK
jgi:predicted outer membrane repeat protein